MCGRGRVPMAPAAKLAEAASPGILLPAGAALAAQMLQPFSWLLWQWVICGTVQHQLVPSAQCSGRVTQRCR